MGIDFRSLSNRNFLVFMMSLLVAVAAVLFVTLDRTYQHANAQLDSQVNASAEVLQYKIGQDASGLRRGLTTTAKDFAIKQLISGAADDPDSLQLALNNYQTRLSSDFLVVTNNSGSIITKNANLFVGLEDIVGLASEPYRLVALGNLVYLTVAVPVRFNENIPNPNAFLLAGLNLSKLITPALRGITSFDVSIRYQNQMVASTLDYSLAELTQEMANPGSIFQHAGAKQHLAQLRGIKSIVYTKTLPANLDMPLVAYYSLPEVIAHVDYESLTVQLLVTIAIVTVFVSFLTFSFSRSVSKPLVELAAIADDIRQGNYPAIKQTSQLKEVESLASALSQMQHAIAKREKEIHQLAFFSRLTSLPNRTFFLTAVKEYIRDKHESQFAILWLDLDRFKDINDTLGHEFGDQVLVEVAKRLDNHKPKDAVLAYLDGDEFAMLLPIDPSLSAADVSARIGSLFQMPFVVDGISLDVAASIGVSVYPEHGTETEILIQLADIALYESKSRHDAVVIYQPQYNKYSVMRLSLMSQLRHAIESGELMLYFQPKLNIATRRIESLECLVRWQHPEHGFVFPDDFIPLAEQTGNIRHLTKWAIKSALQSHVFFAKQGYVLTFAVNISTVDLIDLSLPPFVESLLKEYSVDPKHLTLEVTESALMSDPTNAISALQLLKQMGVTLSIDDFGTGYSSMEQLKRTPVDELKIDKSFVLNLDLEKDDEIIVKSITNLAHSLGLKVVAEGVETEQALNRLAEFKVETAQGYWISKPVPSDALLAWLNEKRFEAGKLIEG